MDVKCPCNNCSEHLEFDRSAVGPTVACPHCGMDTVLFIPQVPMDSQPSEPESAPKPKPKWAKIVEHEQKRTTYRGGVEGRLEKTGDNFWAFGICGLVFGLFAALILIVEGQITWAGVSCIAGIVAFVQGAVINTLFGAGAEIIRLLKKSNGVKFSGEISQGTDHSPRAFWRGGGRGKKDCFGSPSHYNSPDD